MRDKSKFKDLPLYKHILSNKYHKLGACLVEGLWDSLEYVNKEEKRNC